MSASEERVLVLSVDRDGDLERKAGVRSPVFGREEVMAAATRLAVADPEEAARFVEFLRARLLRQLAQSPAAR